ncbi:YcaO-like family protein [Actinokineospora guangxiensis]|uniref:YcaO-like family protein n=1 Tax=Actinokineospora guangxiensis TaxID=1490288 RepID=A0ABW0ES57_9PSEU
MNPGAVALAELATVDPDVPVSVPLDSYTPGQLAELDRIARGRSAPVVPVRVDGGLVVIGPVLQGEPVVCLGCAEDIRLAAFGAAVPRSDAAMRLGGIADGPLRPVVDAVVRHVLETAGGYRDRVVALRLDSAGLAVHRIRPRSGGCAECLPLPGDTAAGAVVHSGVELASAGTLRLPNERTTLAGLSAALLDLRHGPVTGVFRTGHLPLATVTAPIVGPGRTRQSGYGRTVTFADAERIALFEAAERLAGMSPRRRETTVEASFAELGGDLAVDPAALGLHEPDSYADPAFRLTAYHPAARTRWVYGWSYTHRRARLLPEHVVYWGNHNAGARFLTETSNGCGLGNSLAEAVLYGLFEVAERDAFLMAWYASTPLRKLGVDDTDPVLGHLVDRLESLGYQLLFFDATNDLGIPVALAMARYMGADPATPACFFAAGAHPDPRAAMASAAAEIAVDVENGLVRAREKPDDYRRDRLLAMLERPELVRTMEDHVALYGLPEAAGEYAFLLGDVPTVDPAELASTGDERPETDLAALLDRYTGRLAGLGLELIAVDTSEQAVARELGLYSAKVVVPGTLPMTFGHGHRRTRGLTRLFDVPYRLGRAGAPLGEASVSLRPHPFP